MFATEYGSLKGHDLKSYQECIIMVQTRWNPWFVVFYFNIILSFNLQKGLHICEKDSYQTSQCNVPEKDI